MKSRLNLQRYPLSVGIKHLLFAISLFPSAVIAQDILPLRNHRSSSLIFFRPLPLGPILTQDTETRWSFTLANEMRDHPEAYEDAETWRITYLYRASTKEGGEWLIEVPYLIRGGGILDPLLDFWHQAFVDDGNPLRNSTPYGQSRLNLQGNTYGSANGVGDITVGYGRPTPLGDARIWLKLPTGNPNGLLGSGSPDLALSLEKSWTVLPKFRLSAMAGITAQGKPAELDYARGLAQSVAGAIAYKRNSRDTWLIQWTNEPSPQRLSDPLFNASHNLISLAYTRSTGDSAWTVYFMEDGDFSWFSFHGGAQIGPDWTLGLTYSFRK